MEREAAEKFGYGAGLRHTAAQGGRAALPRPPGSTWSDPVAVEHVRASAGLDIGGTLIGMHLKDVAVPLRLKVRQIGEAPVNAARTRPKLIGGRRAVYPDNV